MPNRQTIILCTFFLFLLTSCDNRVLVTEEQSSTQTFRLSNGLEVGLIPPKDFTITQEHYGFTQPESFSRIQLSEKEIAYNNYILQLTKENLLKNKLQLVKQEQVAIGNAECTLLTLRQNIAGVYFEKLWLVCGDNLSSVQVEASFPEGAPSKLKKVIKNSLLTLSVATDQNLRLYTGLPFMFSQTPSFKVKQRYSNSIVLLPVESDNKQASVVVSHGKISQKVENIKILSDHFLKEGKHYKNVEILKEEMIKIDKISALATTAYVELNDKPTFVYQITSYQKENFLLLQGQTSKKNKKAFKINIDKLIEHFSFKE